MKKTTITYDEQTERAMAEINVRPATAVQTINEIFIHLRRATLKELKGRFSSEEITALADSFNGLMPTWQLMVNPSVLVAHTEDAEQFDGAISRHQADPKVLIKKLSELTAAQATILQLEFIRFWNTDGEGGYGAPSPDLDKLIKFLG